MSTSSVTSSVLAVRRTTILAEARRGGLSGLPYVPAVRSSDERVEVAGRAIRSATERVERARVRVGAGAETQVGAGAASTATAGAVYLVAAGATGIFSYALFKGGGWVFEEKHPVWGVLFALAAMSNLWTAGDRLAGHEGT